MISFPRRLFSSSSSSSGKVAPLYHASFKASSLKVEKTTTPKQKLPHKELVFGKTFTDHMLTIDYDVTNGWHTPLLHPFRKICLDPSALVFHYAMECFEGMKAYRDARGGIRLFRPDMNMRRLARSASRFAFPLFDQGELLECVKKLVLLDREWIPSERGYSLYLRPTIIATQESLGVGPSSHTKLFVIGCPVGPYYKTGFNAVSLLSDPANIRAWPGGVGDCKVGGNYAPAIKPQITAALDGFQQNLWLFPIAGEGKDRDYQLTEVGTMNCFLFWRNEMGERELVTCPLDGTILPGVTRDSILTLTRQWGEFKVSERIVTINQLINASKQGRVLEMFGAGTAAIVSPIKKIRYVMGEGKYHDIDIPLDPKSPLSQAGPLAKRLNDTIMAIQYGEVEHEWSVRIEK